MGQLFLDDARMKNFTSCFKDQDFLNFFFKQLRLNRTERYSEYPFLSKCGRERNFLHCDDTPLVVTALHRQEGSSCSSSDWVELCWAGKRMGQPFQPDQLAMDPVSGRLYYASPKPTLCEAVLVRSQVADSLAPRFRWDNGPDSPPTAFWWRGEYHPIRLQLK